MVEDWDQILTIAPSQRWIDRAMAISMERLSDGVMHDGAMERWSDARWSDGNGAMERYLKFGPNRPP